MTDPISDLLTRIRNGIHARFDAVNVPASKIKEEIIKILKAEGYLSGYIKEEKKPQSEFKVFLKYTGLRQNAIHKISRVSTPGGRVYRGYRDIKPRGIGISILSTPLGVMTDRAARQAKIGGEVLCEVW